MSGSACDSHCAGARHALEREHEAAQQDVRQQEEERHLHRLLLRLGERREEQAERQVGGDEHERERVEQRTSEPTSGTSNTRLPGQQDQRHLHVADRDVRHDLADDELERLDRRDDQLLERAALALARDRHRGEHHHGHRQDHADQAGHDVDRGAQVGVVPGVRLELDRLRRGAALPLVRQPRHQRARSSARRPATPRCWSRWPRSADRSRRRRAATLRRRARASGPRRSAPGRPARTRALPERSARSISS